MPSPTPGGGRLADAVQRDGTGAVRRLLGRAVWVPDLAAALALQPSLPAGWVVVALDGVAVLDDTTVLLGAADGLLERRAEHARWSADLERAEADLVARRMAAESATTTAGRARDALETARADEARRPRRDARRRRPSAARRATSRPSRAKPPGPSRRPSGAPRRSTGSDRPCQARPRRRAGETPRHRDADRPAVATWEARATDLRERRDRLAARLAEHDAARRSAEDRSGASRGVAALADERVARAGRDAEALTEREGALTGERDAVQRELATARAAEASARAALGELHAADATDRSRLTDAERAASGARELLRSADDRLRAADHAELEARLGLEALREGVLVELAGLGELGLASLGVAVAAPVAPSGDDAEAMDGDADRDDDADDEVVAEDTATSRRL